MIYWLIIRTLLSGVLFLYLQVLFMPHLAIGGIIPNLFLGWLVYQVWRKPVNMIVPIIFLLGLCYDITMPETLGLQTTLLVLLAVGIDVFHRPLEKDSYITMGITVGLVSLAYSVLIFPVYGFLAGFSGKLILSMLGLALYNMVVSAAVTLILVLVSNLKLDFRHG